MNARELLREGDLRQSLDLLKAEVRRAPRDPKLRIFLFQMFCVTGEWDRALTQLKLLNDIDKPSEPMVQTYTSAIRCEVLREKVFRGARSPTVFGDPGDWVPLLIEATRLLASGQPGEAAKLRDAAFEAAPSALGSLNGADFEWVADADPRLGPVIEAVVEGKYMWIPFHRIKQLNVEEPADLRDQVWMPARFTWSNDGEAVALIPTRYPGSAASADPAIQLARKTDWLEQDADWSLPIGQRVFITDTDETALMDVRKLSVVHAPAEAGAA